MKFEVLALSVTLMLAACNPIEEGIDKFYSGHYEHAIVLLKSEAEKQGRTSPSFTIVSKTSDIQGLLVNESDHYFKIWHAYAGSFFGLDDRNEGCRQTKLALRKIEVNNPLDKSSSQWDPREGNFWNDEPKTLRAWWLNEHCTDFYPEEPLLEEKDEDLEDDL